MNNSPSNAKRSVGWMGIHRGHQARPLEWLAEQPRLLAGETLHALRKPPMSWVLLVLSPIWEMQIKYNN